MKRILFVCTGNTCRSPMAEALLRYLAREKGIEVETRSAGVYASEGSPMSENSAHVLRAKGIEDAFVSSPVTEEHIAWADLILTMTASHKQLLTERHTRAIEKTFTLIEYVNEDKFSDIGDPFGGPREAYEQCAADIERHLAKLLDLLKDGE